MFFVIIVEPKFALGLMAGLSKQQLRESIKPAGLTSFRSISHKTCVRNNADFEVTKSQSDSVMEIYEPFMSEGYISLAGDLTKHIPIKNLRDTGASQSIILADVLPFSEKTYSGTSVLLQGVE